MLCLATRFDDKLPLRMQKLGNVAPVSSAYIMEADLYATECYEDINCTFTSL